MKFKTFKIFTIVTFLGSGVMVSCSSDPNSPGVEYMPDMYRSPSIEAYVDYAEVRGLFRPELVNDEVSMIPPAGTIPYFGTGDNVAYMMPYNHGAPIGSDKSHGLYGVSQDSIGRDGAKWDNNPIEYSEETLKKGKGLYEIFCIQCHGESGDGQGTVITNSLGKFPTPGGYSSELTAGEIFYTITYGKGAMGSHASQLNKEERWNVVWYVLQLSGQDVEAYGNDNDTLTIDMPLPVEPEGNNGIEE